MVPKWQSISLTDVEPSLAYDERRLQYKNEWFGVLKIITQKKFRGKEPSVDALLKRAGLL